MKRSLIWTGVGAAVIGLGVPAYAASQNGTLRPTVVTVEDSTTSSSVDDTSTSVAAVDTSTATTAASVPATDASTSSSVEDDATESSVENDATESSVDDDATESSVEDVSGKCDEAEHADDAECTGATAGTTVDDNSGPGNANDANDDNSGSGSGSGSDDSGHHGGGDHSGGDDHGPADSNDGLLLPSPAGGPASPPDWRCGPFSRPPIGCLVAQQYPPAAYSCEWPSPVELTSAPKRSTLSQKRSTSSSVCIGEIVHCSLLPHGAMNTPPLCCTRK